MAIRWYATTTLADTSYGEPDNEVLGDLTAPGSGSLSGSVAKGNEERVLAISTPSGSPNDANWPSGTWLVGVNATTFPASLSLEQGNSVNRASKVARMSSALSELEHSEGAGTWDSTTGTGLHVFTRTGWDPAAGATTDRLTGSVGIANSDTKNAQSYTFTLGTGTYIEGPFAASDRHAGLVRPTVVSQAVHRASHW